MAKQQASSKTIYIIRWIAQVILAVVLIWAAAMKLFQPVEKLAAMWPWTGQVPVALVKFTGLVDLAGALGLVLPSLLRTQSKLTYIAAMGIILLMIIAGVFHIVRGEASQTGVNIFIAIVAAFIVYSYTRKI